METTAGRIIVVYITIYIITIVLLLFSEKLFLSEIQSGRWETTKRIARYSILGLITSIAIALICNRFIVEYLEKGHIHFRKQVENV
jgi:hypothetical protein